MPVLNFICGLLHFYSKKIMLVLIHIFVRMNWLLCRISGTSFRVVVENDEQVELSFTRMWDSSLEGKYIPLNIDKRSLFNFYMYECIYKCINAIGITYIYIYIHKINEKYFNSPPGLYCYVVPQASTHMPFTSTCRNGLVLILAKQGLLLNSGKTSKHILSIFVNFLIDCLRFVCGCGVNNSVHIDKNLKFLWFCHCYI
jgi:hypothetical protein